MDPDVTKLAQLLVVVGGFGAFIAVVVVLLRAAMWATRGSKRSAIPEAPRIDDSRFARLEEAVDSIAIEVERIAEAQRFSAKLMSERLPIQLPDGGARKLP